MSFKNDSGQQFVVVFKTKRLQTGKFDVIKNGYIYNTVVVTMEHICWK